MTLARRCFKVTNDIFRGLQKQNMLETQFVTGKKITRAVSMTGLDETAALRESPEAPGVEGLLRLWYSDRSKRDVEATRKEFEQLVGLDQLGSPGEGQRSPQSIEDAQFMAFKRAEVSGWFLGAATNTLKRGNLEQWVAWAFWNATPEDIVLDDDEQGTEQAMLKRMVDEAQEEFKLDLAPGLNHDAKCIRLTLDPIQTSYRPLAFYAVTHVSVKAATAVLMWSLGFQKYSAGSLDYWHRKANKEASAAHPKKEPVVFCHGLGVGVLPYIGFLSKIISANVTDEIFCVELPHISMRIKREVPSAAELVVNITGMLEAWHIKAAHFIGHSFGSVVMAWVTQKAKHLIVRATFLDPVVFLLCKSDVAYNFVYRKPTTPAEHLMQYFVSRELYIAHSLGRNFIWHECILWPEDVGYPQGTFVLLSGLDSIVPAHSVKRYLEYTKAQTSAARGGSRLDVCFFENCGHAQFLLCKSRMDEVIARAFKTAG